MVWINLIKNYLVALSSKNIEFLKDNFDNHIHLNYNNNEYKNKTDVINFITSLISNIDDISIKIHNIAYHDKLFFIEYEMRYKYTDFNKYQEIKKCVDVINIGYSGKIISITNYKQ